MECDHFQHRFAYRANVLASDAAHELHSRNFDFDEWWLYLLFLSRQRDHLLVNCPNRDAEGGSLRNHRFPSAKSLAQLGWSTIIVGVE